MVTGSSVDAHNLTQGRAGFENLGDEAVGDGGAATAGGWCHKADGSWHSHLQDEAEGLEFVRRGSKLACTMGRQNGAGQP